MGRRKGHWRLGFAGFGNVNRALARLLLERRAELQDRWGLTFTITMLSSRSRGALVKASGIDAARALEEGWSTPVPAIEAIRSAPIDLLFEGTPLNPHDGEPATTHVRAALERGVSVVTANKGPIAFAAADLLRLAAGRRAGLRFESAVADCLPVFNLLEVALPAGRVAAFHGILNSTSNRVLQAAARGATIESAVAEAQRLGIAEADPAHDLDGWDQAVKAVILANLVLERACVPADVERTPLSRVDLDWVRAEHGRGRAVRLIASGDRQGPPRVGPVSLASREFLAVLEGGSLGLVLDTELAGTLMIGIAEPGVGQTAYGMLTDLVAIHEGRPGFPGG